jgi:alpha-L-fucosidase
MNRNLPLLSLLLLVPVLLGASRLNETTDGSEFERQEARYTPELRESMRNLYHDKVGLFIHWGPYTQLGGEWEGIRGAEWIMRHANIPVSNYEEAAARPFKPEKFDAAEWVALCEAAGMGFMVITSKHHDGFAMFESAHPYNIKDFGGFGRDPLAELHRECQKAGLRFGVYYSQSQDWHEPGGDGNRWQGWPELNPARFEQYYREKALPQVEELVTRFDPLFMVWFDTPGRFMSPEIIEDTMALVEQHQPGALINSRIGGGYGHFESASDLGMMPCVNKTAWSEDLKVPWQTHSTVSGTWGYAAYKRALHEDPNRSANWHIYSLADIVSKGGVLLLNVAPDASGEIPIGQANVLRRLGQWLEVNGEAIYDADPSPIRNPALPITQKFGKLYFHIKEQAAESVTIEGISSPLNRCYLLSDPKVKFGPLGLWKKKLPFTQQGDRITIDLPADAFDGAQGLAVVAAEYDGKLSISDPTLLPDSDGVLALPVSKCRYNKLNISYDAAHGCTHKLAMPWDQGGNALIWDLRIMNPGKYRLRCRQAFAPGLEGAHYSVRVGEQTIKAVPQFTQHGRDFAWVDLGLLDFDTAGDFELVLTMHDGARPIKDAAPVPGNFLREFSIQAIELQAIP